MATINKTLCTTSSGYTDTTKADALIEFLSLDDKAFAEAVTSCREYFNRRPNKDAMYRLNILREGEVNEWAKMIAYAGAFLALADDLYALALSQLMVAAQMKDGGDDTDRLLKRLELL